MSEDLTRTGMDESTEAEAAAEAQRGDGEATIVSGAEGSETLVGQAATVVNQPAAGETVTIQVVAGLRLILNFDPALAQVEIDGDDFILVFNAGTPDEARLVFLDLVLLAQGDDPPVLQVAGVAIGSDVLVGQAVALAGEQPDLETAAGQAGEPGHGANVYNDDLGTLIDLLDPQGVIPPVFLQFPIPQPIQPITFALEEAPPTPMVRDSAFGFDETPGIGVVDGDPQGDEEVDPLPDGNAKDALESFFDGEFTTCGQSVHTVSVQNVSDADMNFQTGDPVMVTDEDGNTFQMTSQGELVYYFVDPSDSDLVVGVTDLGDPTGSAVFALYLDDSAASSGGGDGVMTFDGGEGSPLSFDENGLTVMSKYNVTGDHIHLTGTALNNHNSCCSAPYEFTATGGGAFSMLSFDVVFSSGFFIHAIVDGSVVDSVFVASGFTGTVDLPSSFQNVDAVRWGDDDATDSGGTIDNVVFALGEGTGDGELTFTYVEFQQVDHPDVTDPDDSLELEIDYTATGPGGTAEATATLTIEDDGPDAEGGEGGPSADDDMIVYDETSGVQGGTDEVESLPAEVAALFEGLELEVCGQAVDRIVFDYGKDAPFTTEGGEGETWGGISLTQADGSAYSGQDSGLDRTSDGQSIFLFSVPQDLLGGVLTDVVVGIAGEDAADALANFTALIESDVTDDLVFAVALDDSGALSGADNESFADVGFVQFQAIEHDISGDDSGGEHNDLEQFSVYYTVTDGDHDTSTQEFTIKILDDGPSIEGAEGAMVAHDETPGVDLDADDTDTALPAAFAARLAALSVGTEIGHAQSSGQQIAFDPGKDGLKNLSLTDSSGGAFDGTVDSGLDTTDGDDIFLLSDSNDNIVLGVTAGGDIVFALYLDESDNSLWLTQYEAIANTQPGDGSGGTHDETDSITNLIYATITDGDDDTATTSTALEVKFQDDGPVADIEGAEGAMLVLDESVGFDAGDANADDETDADAPVGAIGFAEITAAALFTDNSDAGTDGEKSKVYSLTLNAGATGLVDVVSGEAVVLVDNGGVIEGRTEFGDDLVFTITVDAVTGDVDVAQFRALEHDDSGDPDESSSPEIMSSGLVLLTQTVTDNDDDTDTDSIELGSLIKFEDDGPVAVDDSDTAEINGSTITGNVIDGEDETPDTDDAGEDDVGTDGFGLIRSVTHDGVTYTFVNSTTVSNDGGLTQGTEYTFVGGTLTIVETDQGGSFSIDLTGADIGDYSYTPPTAGGTQDFEEFDYVLEDGDGDTDEATLTISFDDLPDPGTPDPLVHDETPGVDTDSIEDDVDSTTAYGGLDASTQTAITSLGLAADFAGSLSVAQDSFIFDFGLDGPGSISLDDIGTAGVASGLTDTDTGFEIFLYSEGGLLVGRVGESDGGSGSQADADGAIAFVVILEETGTASGANNESTATTTVAQYRAIVHDDPADHDEDNGGTDAPGGATDEFITVGYTVTDFDGDPNPGDATFIVSFEDDGPSISDGVASVTVDESPGLQTLSDGDQSDPPFEDDNDDDTAATLPTALSDLVTNESLTVLEKAESAAGLVSYDGGTDGVKSVKLTASDGTALTAVATGLFTLDGNQIYLYTIGDVVVGREGSDATTASATGDIIFAVYLDTGADLQDSSDDTLWVVQFEALAHGDDTDHDDVESLSGAVYLTVVDNDDDEVTASSALTINFEDDGPSPMSPDAAILANSSDGTATESLDMVANIGTDKDGNAVFVNNAGDNLLRGSIGGEAAELLTSGGVTSFIYLFGFGTSVLTATTDITNTDSGAVVFTATLNSDGTYTIDMNGAIDIGQGENFDDFNQVAAGNNLWAGVSGDSLDILLTAGVVDSTSEVNTSNQGLGIENNLIGDGEGVARIDFVTNLDLINDGEAPNDNAYFGDLGFVEYDDHMIVNGGRVKISGITGGGNGTVDVEISAFDVDSDAGMLAGDYLNDGPPLAIIHTDIVVLDENGNPITIPAGQFVVEGSTVPDDATALYVQLNTDGSITVFNVDNNWTITEINTEFGFDRLEVENVDVGGDNSFRISEVGFGDFETGDPVVMSFDVAITDEDGDPAVVDPISVTLLPQLNGTDGNNVLVGNGDAEFLVGGLGDDTLTGDGGADIFVFNLGVDDGDDTITDFDGTEDLLSFADVVDGVGDDIADVDAMITSIVDDGNGDVQVNFTNGGTLVFENVTFTAQTSISELVTIDEQIIVDHV